VEAVTSQEYMQRHEKADKENPFASVPIEPLRQISPNITASAVST
jgi:hypothetical protein